MKKIILILFAAFYIPSISAKTLCYPGRANQDVVDRICFDQEQVEAEHVSRNTTDSDPRAINVKLLNVPTPITIYADIEKFKKQLK